MKTLYITQFVILLLAACDSGETVVRPTGQEHNKWTLVFQDEFEGQVLDTSRWTVGYGWGIKTGWTQEVISPAHVAVLDGRLILSGEPKSANEYWAGAVNTKNKFFQEYGFFEARIKAAKGRGVLTGWWGKPNSEQWPPEIDIAEIFGAVNPNGDTTIGPWASSMNIHYRTSAESGKKEDQSFYTLPNGNLYTDDFHTLAVEWNPDEVIWYIDGAEVKRTSDGTSFLRGDFYWILNLHICSREIEWPGCPDSINVWPTVMEVDYVRAWKKRS